MSDTEIRMMHYTIEQLSAELQATRQYVSDIESKLERTRKALGVAKDTFNWIDETYRTGQETEAEIWGKVQLAAQEITALEQKDVK